MLCQHSESIARWYKRSCAEKIRLPVEGVIAVLIALGISLLQAGRARGHNRIFRDGCKGGVSVDRLYGFGLYRFGRFMALGPFW
jgi:hypothetical protein